MPKTNLLYLQAFHILCHWCKSLYNDVVLPDKSYCIVADLAPMILPSQNEATVILPNYFTVTIVHSETAVYF